MQARLPSFGIAFFVIACSAAEERLKRYLTTGD